MRKFWEDFRGALGRVFPSCLTQAQAAAAGMLLAFFPLLLLVVGIFSLSETIGRELEEVLLGLRSVLPANSRKMVLDFLTGRGRGPWFWMVFGLGGTLLGGTQVMMSLMQGQRQVWRDTSDPPFWREQGRALVLLCVTIMPWLFAAVAMLFGREFSRWLTDEMQMTNVGYVVSVIVNLGVALVVAVIVLMVFYRLARRAVLGWPDVFPGALLATLLWWVVNAMFELYVRHMPYGVIYGSLAAAIGLLVWMNLSALVVLIGAGFNAQIHDRRRMDLAEPAEPAAVPENEDVKV